MRRALLGRAREATTEQCAGMTDARRRRVVVVVAVLAAAGALVGAAFGDAVVSFVSGSPPNVSITTPHRNGVPDPEYRLAIEPFQDNFFGTVRKGIRVRQLVVGGPAITSGTPDRCNANPAFNDVVCFPGPFGKISITTGDASDDVELDNCQHDNCLLLSATGPPCVATSGGVPHPLPALPVMAQLGAGDDVLTAVTLVADTAGNCPFGNEHEGVTQDIAFNPILTADGSLGNDALHGGPLGDTLSGNLGDDTISGGDGNDTLKGNDGADTLGGGPGVDQLDGGSGNDALTGDDGNDVLNGGGGTASGDDTLIGDAGDDTLVGGFGNDTIDGGDNNDQYLVSSADAADGADTFSGGPGFDTANYALRNCPLTITIGNGQPDDGCPGEGDNVVDTDKLIGGTNGDDLTGSSAAETIVGGGGADTIRGGPGSDTLQAGPGSDTVDALDGEQDTVSCGIDADTAILDLKDTLVLFGATKATRVPDCEAVTRAAVDDSPPGRPLRRPVRLGSAAAAVRFSCPAASRPACRGRLFLYDLRRPRRALGSIRYSLRLGTAASIRIPLPRPAIAELRASRRALVRTVEQGHSRVGPRSAEFQLPVSV